MVTLPRINLLPKEYRPSVVVIPNRPGNFVKYPAIVRFLTKVDKRGPIWNGTHCWTWIASTVDKQRGAFSLSRSRYELASRSSYKFFVGPIPDGMLVCHKCDNPSCVNPAHLFTGTHKDNMQDCSLKGRTYKPDMRGERNPRRKLTVKQVLEIRSSKLPRIKLAGLFGVSRTNIGDIQRRDTWRSI